MEGDAAALPMRTHTQVVILAWLHHRHGPAQGCRSGCVEVLGPLVGLQHSLVAPSDGASQVSEGVFADHLVFDGEAKSEKAMSRASSSSAFHEHL